jgi:hypothetical protein
MTGMGIMEQSNTIFQHTCWVTKTSIMFQYSWKMITRL